MLKNINDLLENILPQSNWKIFLLKNWPTIIGNLHTHVRLEKIQEDNTLILGVYNTAWMQELYCLSGMILKKINTTLEYPHVKQLRFKYTPAYKKKIKPGGEKRRIDKKISLNIREQRALQRINDPELRTHLEAFFTRCRQEEYNEKKESSFSTIQRHTKLLS